MATRSVEYEDVGYIKYTGNDVERGIIDAGSAGSALTGLDEALRFFNRQQSPDFATLQYDIPVQTRPGSWEAVVLEGPSQLAEPSPWAMPRRQVKNLLRMTSRKSD